MVYDFAHDDDIRIYGFDDQIPVGIWEGQCTIDMWGIAEDLADLSED